MDFLAPFFVRFKESFLNIFIIVASLDDHDKDLVFTCSKEFYLPKI